MRGRIKNCPFFRVIFRVISCHITRIKIIYIKIIIIYMKSKSVVFKPKTRFFLCLSQKLKTILNRFKSCYPHPIKPEFTGFFYFVSYFRVIQFWKTFVYTVILFLCFLFQNVSVYLFQYGIWTPASTLHDIMIRNVHSM